MTLDLALPAGWEWKGRGERPLAQSRDGLLALVCSGLETGAPGPAWIVNALRACAPADRTVHVDRPVERETVDGWPLVLVDARFRRADGADAGVARAAFYRFLAHRAYAIALGVGAAELAAAQPALDEALLAARPDHAGAFLGPCDFYGPGVTPARER